MVIDTLDAGRQHSLFSLTGKGLIGMGGGVDRCTYRYCACALKRGENKCVHPGVVFTSLLIKEWEMRNKHVSCGAIWPGSDCWLHPFTFPTIDGKCMKCWWFVVHPWITKTCLLRKANMCCWTLFIYYIYTLEQVLIEHLILQTSAVVALCSLWRMAWDDSTGTRDTFFSLVEFNIWSVYTTGLVNWFLVKV